MRITEIIERKKRGDELTPEEIHFFVEEYVSGTLPDYQISALLMAVWFSGMTIAETSALTIAMAESGDQIDLSAIDGVPVDKHSTGGVADTTTLIVAPVVAACGGYVAKMSGRGLGHTGGTLDKLEAIPGFRVDLSREAFIRTVNRCGFSIVGQTANLVPADKKLYGLRDVTRTVDSIPLIASSIMSKKLAAGASGIVLDVKWGSGAFMKSSGEAEQLARTMVSLGKRAGRRTVAVVTDMNQPLGNAVGNALDVAEAIRVLRGEAAGDLLSVSLVLASELLLLAGIETELSAAVARAERAIASGDALARLAMMIEAQHGDPRVVEDPGLLPSARRTVTVKAVQSGYVGVINASEIGAAAGLLGAGRQKKGEAVDPSVGVEVRKRLGESVHKGDELFLLHVNREGNLGEAKRRLTDAIGIEEEPPQSPSLILTRISEKG